MTSSKQYDEVLDTVDTKATITSANFTGNSVIAHNGWQRVVRPVDASERNKVTRGEWIKISYWL